MKKQANYTAQYKSYNDTFQDTKEKDYNPLEESNLIYFEKDNYSKHYKRCTYNIIPTSYIDLSGSKHSLLFSMNINTKGKQELITYIYADTIVADILNCLVEVSQTVLKVTLVGFDDDLSKKSIPIVYAATAIYLPHDILIAHLNKTPLLHGSANPLLYKSQAFQFVLSIRDVFRCYGGKQYIHPDNQVVPMKFYKAMMHVTIW